jgi:hypothetical protein
MDQRERISDFEESLRAALTGWQAGLWTALPGVINSYDAAKMTVTVQPSIKIKRRLQDGSYTWEKLPLLLDCPVVFPGGGGFAVTFPVKKDDECLVIFSSRCIDTWWQSGGVDNIQAELRLHDLSDGFAIVGPFSQSKVLASVSTTTAQLRNLAGDAYVELAAGGVVNIKAPGGLNVNGNTVVTGTMQASGEITAVGTHTVSAHKHGGVTAGGGQTGTPTG